MATQAQLERDLQMQAKSLSELVLDQRSTNDDIGALKQANAMRNLKDEYLDDRLDRIEASIQSVYNLGKWLLGAVGSTLVVAVVGFALRGGPLG